jgi:acetylornithine deacetylase/succinyl-diaminopimelate desuccinylase-like protein
MENLIPHLAWLDDQQQPMVDLVQELCDVNSGTLNLEGLENVKQRLVKEFKQLDGEISLVDTQPWKVVEDSGNVSTQPLGQIIHITKWPDAPKKVVLCIHYDTVYSVDHPFQTCQLTEGGQLNGPGVSDAKGGIVVLLNALRTLERSPLAGKIGWEVILNPDEEIGSPGSEFLIRQRATQCDVGMSLNMVPDLAVGRINIRVKSLEQQSAVELELADLVEKYNEIDGISVEMAGKFTSPPKPVDEASEKLQQQIEQCGAALGQNITWKGTGGACDGNKFADAGLPNVDTFGPCGGNIHSSNEYLVTQSMVPRTKLAALTLLNLCE